jgi:lysophospholipase L1-like esterase
MLFLVVYLALRVVLCCSLPPGKLFGIATPLLPEATWWPLVHGFWLCLDFLLLLFLASRWLQRIARNPRIGRWLFVPLYGVVLFAYAQALFWMLLEYELAAADPRVRPLYQNAFQSPTPKFIGHQYIFRKHHYLSYCLNTDTEWMGAAQFNAQYKIRRGEPVRPRREVRWRALAIGGSTTFGHGIPREEDTWVHQLERHIRARYGDDCDVINGGVPAYTVMENSIHYLTFLTHLDADVIILFVGINDILPRLVGDLQPDYSNFRHCWEDRLPDPIASLKWFFPYRYYYAKRYLVPAPTLTSIHDFVSYLNRMPAKPDVPALMRHNSADTYRRALENLVLLLRARGQRVVIVPQIERHPDQKLVAEEFNAIGARLAKRLNLPFAASLPAAFADDDFLDQHHFNTTGNRKMAEALFAFLEQQAAVPGAARSPEVPGYRESGE